MSAPMCNQCQRNPVSTQMYIEYEYQPTETLYLCNSCVAKKTNELYKSTFMWRAFEVK